VIKFFKNVHKTVHLTAQFTLYALSKWIFTLWYYCNVQFDGKNPHVGDAWTSDGRKSVALSGAGGADGSLKNTDSGSAGFWHSRSRHFGTQVI